ncbi:hypothetical protein SAZ_41125 [Streptomyces noursei ZPM]|nr:hypothetical protein SAZ_41125 [Streptomyces noursei ZPM]
MLQVLGAIGGKWRVLVVGRPRDGTLRFGALRRYDAVPPPRPES